MNLGLALDSLCNDWPTPLVESLHLTQKDTEE